MLVDLKKLVTVLVMISSIFVLTNKRLRASRANSGEIKTFYGVPFFHALVRGEPFCPGPRNFVTKN